MHLEVLTPKQIKLLPFLKIFGKDFGLVGGISNFVMDLTGSYPYGQLIVWLYPLFITYGIYVDEIKIKIRF